MIRVSPSQNDIFILFVLSFLFTTNVGLVAYHTKNKEETIDGKPALGTHARTHRRTDKSKTHFLRRLTGWADRHYSRKIYRSYAEIWSYNCDKWFKFRECTHSYRGVHVLNIYIFIRINCSYKTINWKKQRKKRHTTCQKTQRVKCILPIHNRSAR